MLALQKFSRTDRLVDASWRTVTWAMICALSLASFILIYCSLMLAFSGKWEALAAPAAGGFVLAVAAVLLCRYRNDLIGT